MPRSLALVAAWLLAAALSLAVAWRGVGVIDDQVTGNRPAPLTAEELSSGAPAGSGSGSTTAPGPTSTTTTSTPVPGPADQPAPVNRTYQVQGGSATLAFTPSGVSVVVATPNPGFEVETEPEDGGIRVEFESDSHRSRIDGWWDGGPQDETREEPQGDGDSGGGSG